MCVLKLIQLGRNAGELACIPINCVVELVTTGNKKCELLILVHRNSEKLESNAIAAWAIEKETDSLLVIGNDFRILGRSKIGKFFSVVHG